MSTLSSRLRRASLVASASLLLALPSFAHAELNSPNGGEVLQPGSTFDIVWMVTVEHNLIDWDLHYSTAGPNGPWTPIAIGLPPGNPVAGSIHTHSWNVPSISDGTVWVQVVMHSEGSDYTDESDGPFAIGARALATLRNGTGANPSCYSSATAPLIGGTWSVDVDHSSHPGATLTYVIGYTGSATGSMIRAGEILVDLSSQRLIASLQNATGSSNRHDFPVPNDPALSGLQAATQAMVLGGVPQLCNALDTTIGY